MSFIEVHEWWETDVPDGVGPTYHSRVVLMNPAAIQRVTPHHEHGSKIEFIDGLKMNIEETYDQLKVILRFR